MIKKQSSSSVQHSSTNSNKSWRNIAIDFLSRREHSRYELYNKLISKGASSTDIEALLEELAVNGWQSDDRYCEMIVRNRSQKGFGQLRVYHDLMQQGISKLKANVHIEDVDWGLSLNKCWQKKYNAKKPQNAQQYAKQKRFLLQRGFTSEQINQLLNSKI